MSMKMLSFMFLSPSGGKEHEKKKPSISFTWPQLFLLSPDRGRGWVRG
jgi:hypothetical protein